MIYLYRAFFVVSALAAAGALWLAGGCAEVPGESPVDPGDIVVPYIVTSVDGALNGYCLYPITFTAFPASKDLRHIEAIYLDPDTAAGAEAVMLSAPTWSAEFSYADTGTHAARMRVVLKGGGHELAEEFEVRTAVRFDVPPVSVAVSDSGSLRVLRAGGYRHSGAFWVWDLTAIGGGVVKTLEDTVSVFIHGEYDAVLELYQEDAGGRRTPGVEVSFRSVISTTYSVVVDVEGGGSVEVSPQREFSVPYNGEVSVGVGAQRNTRIISVAVDGRPWYAFADTLVFDTALTVSGIKVDTRILVTAVKIDSVLPVVEIVWPKIDNKIGEVSTICPGGRLVYRLNKQMASGVIRWVDLSYAALPGVDSLRTVRVPEDIFPFPHNVVGELSLADTIINESPSDYLREGLSWYYQGTSPIAAKQYQYDRTTYRIELQFTDSLGNVSALESRIISATIGQHCPYSIREWINVE